jgi:hypothetical protein
LLLRALQTSAIDLDGMAAEVRQQRGVHLFPDDWTPGKIDNAISDAFRNGTKNTDGTWEGIGPDNLPIKGYYDVATGSIKHGFPSI